MSTISSYGGLRGIAKAIAQMAKVAPSEIAKSNQSSKLATRHLLTAEELAEQNARYAGDAEILAQLKKEIAAREARNNINSKSASGTPASSTQPSTPTETASPATGTSPAPTTPVASAPTATTPTASETVAGADPNWTDPVGNPGQNHIFFPNVASLSRETAAAVYKQVSSMVKTQDVSQSVIHAHNGSAGTYSVDTYMSWLAQRAATNILA